MYTEWLGKHVPDSVSGSIFNQNIVHDNGSDTFSSGHPIWFVRFLENVKIHT